MKKRGGNKTANFPDMTTCVTAVKKQLPLILAATGAACLVALLLWAFSQHGTTGMFRVNILFRAGVTLLAAWSVLLLAGGISYPWWSRRLKPAAVGWLKVLLVIPALAAIITSAAAFSIAGGVFSAGIGDTPPQLMVADGTGAYSIPDIGVTFNTAQAVTSTMKWGSGEVVNTAASRTASKQHVFMLRDLQPATTYWYQVNDGPVTYFTTPPVSGPLRLAIASDAHFGAGTASGDTTRQMLAEIARPENGFDMFLFLGDLVEYGFLPGWWQQAFEAFSAASSTVPVRYAPGNHDTLFAGFGNYQAYCYPEGMELQTGSRLWYRLDIGNVHLLVLDVEWSAESFTRAQHEWLEAQLKSIPRQDWVIVLSHGFYYASGVDVIGWQWYNNPETIELITPLFEQYGVDLVVSGHNHNLELLEHNGVIYAICGAFGSRPDPERTYTSPASLWYQHNTRGFVDLTIDGDEGVLVFRDAGFNPVYTHTFSK